jgi:CRISPR-associated protein Csx10
MKALLYTITLDEPLLATSLQGDPNSSISLAYLPGSMLRGMLIARYLEQHPGSDPDTDKTFRQHFFDGSTRYLPAYPLHEQQRTIPTPHCLFYGKHTDLDSAGVLIANLHSATWTPDERRTFDKQYGAFKALEAKRPFCHLVNKSITLHDPARTLTIHTQRDRRRGRATRTEGAIFRYEALAAGQSLQAVVLCDTDSDSTFIRNLLTASSSVRLGRSRSAHYGQATLTLHDEQTNWHEMDIPPADLAAGPHTLLLLSDTLLCTPQGQVATSIDAALLAQALGLPAEQVTLDKTRSFTSSVLHGGYNTTWRLPLPQQPALAAGSLISFTLTQALPAAAVQRLQEQGIGLRRAEGFGRIAFDPSLPDQLAASQPAEPVLVAPTLTADEQTFAQQMAARLARQRTENAVQAYVQGCTFTNLPRRSQLNELRTLVRSAADQGPAAAIAALGARLTDMKPTARRQFERARIIPQDGPALPFAAWLADPLGQSAGHPIIKDMQSAPPTVARQKPPSANQQQVVLDLLAAVLEKAARAKGARDER